jgi:hypothetical protein
VIAIGCLRADEVFRRGTEGEGHVYSASIAGLRLGVCDVSHAGLAQHESNGFCVKKGEHVNVH